MRIATTGKDFAENITIYAMGDIDPKALEPAVKYGTDEPDLFDGKSVYRIRDVYVKDGDRQVTASIKLLAKPAAAISEMTKVALTGRVVVTPYVQNGSGRIGYSIVADGVEPVKAGA